MNRDLDPQLVWRGKDEQDWSDLGRSVDHEGVDFRLAFRKVIGFPLALGEQVIHMSIFAREGG